MLAEICGAGAAAVGESALVKSSAPRAARHARSSSSSSPAQVARAQTRRRSPELGETRVI